MLGILIIGATLAAFAAATCYEPTTAHPLPDYDAEHPVLKSAFTHLEALLTVAAGDAKYNATSFSAEITSSEQSLWSMHRTASERNASRPDMPRVNGDALYRIASITKSFTVLGILQQHAAGNLSLDDPIDKYVARLHEEQKGSIPWADITLRSLASQLSGIPREIAQADIINRFWKTSPPPEEFGFPPVSREGLPDCDEYSCNYAKPCTADNLLNIITARDPIFAPNQKSTYSNVAFELLGLVLANVTNQTYASYIHEAIFEPLGMTKSTLSKPPDSAGVIPLDPHFYDNDLGIQNPTGGIYSSSSDLSNYLQHILTHYNGLTHAASWINPASPSGGLYSFYGMPWEIFHTDRILPNSQRPVRFITKSGRLPGYTSRIALLPEYDIGVTLLVAGPSESFSELWEILTVEVVRAAEQLAILQLQQRYAGLFVSPDPELNSSVRLVAGARGLVVEKFISNSTDVLDSIFPKFLGSPPDGPWIMQLAPTLLYRDQESQQGELWRMIIAADRRKDEHAVWDDFCITDMDTMMYAGLPANEVSLWKGSNGLFNDLELTGFRTSLTRVYTDVIATEQQDISEL